MVGLSETLSGTEKSVERAYQAAKALDQEEREAIRQAPTAFRARQLGRQVALRPDWEHVKRSIMFLLALHKFRDPELGARLLATDNQGLVYGNDRGDTYWGQSPLGVGHNHLGHILMTVRLLLRNPVPER
jgi:ribA/ribD-fused uncharacterized protein